MAGGEATVTGYTGTGGNVLIPGTLGGVPVTRIGDFAFQANTSITGLTLPVSVTAIGQKAFENCSQLTSISLPSSVATIGTFAFAGCSSLTSITLPTSLTILDDYVFQGCAALTTIVVPNGVTTVGANAFESCGNLASVTLPGSLTRIKSRAFFFCSSLTRITIPASVSTIEFNAFLNSSTLAEVKFEGANPPASIGANAFSGLAAGAKGIYPASASANWSSVVIPGLLLEPGALTVAAQPVISSGWNHTLYLPVSGGSALAWGFNSDGRCGLGHTNSPVTSGERITGAGGTTLSNLVAVAAGGGHSLVLQANTGVRSLFTAGANSSGQLGFAAMAGTNRFTLVTGAFTNPLAIAAGGRHSLVLDADGKVYTFGDNASGQLGQGGTTPVSVTNPTQVTLLANIQAVAAGTDHSLALTIGGQVYAWGRANGGALGFAGIAGIGTPRLLATNVTAGGVTNANGMTNLVQIVAGERHSLFLRGDGKVFASGVNSSGQLGLGSNVVSVTWPTEVPMPGGVAIRRIAGGLRGAHAFAADGRVFAWGYNEYGELGLGTATTNSPYAVWTPTEVPAFYRAQQIASGTFQTFVLDESGGLLATGYNRQGQLGVGGTNNVTAVPAPTAEAGKTNQTINFANPVGPFYVGGTTNLTASASSGLPVAFFSGDTNRATVSSNTVTFRAAGAVTITARQPGNDSFNAAPGVARSLLVENRPAPVLSLPGSVNGTVGVSFSYRLVSDDSLASYAATGLPAGLVLNPVTGEITGTPTAATSATGAIVTVEASNSSGTGTGTFRLVVSLGSQSVTFSPLPTKTFADAAFNLTATASSGLPVSYVSSNTNVATISGNVVTITGAGTATITASQAGNANWNPATPVSYPLTVSKATPTISAAPTASGITYGQTLADSTLAGGEAKLGTNLVAGSFAFTTPTLTPNAGTANQGVTFTPADTVNYNTTSAVVSVTVNKATPTISAAPTAAGITYGQTLADSTLAGGEAKLGTNVVAGSFAFTTPTLTPNAGTANQGVTFTPTDTANYNTASTVVSVTVNKAVPTISAAPMASAITAGQALSTSSLTGGTASVAGAFAWTSDTTVPTASGSYAVTFTPTDAANYATATTNVSVTVNPANSAPLASGSATLASVPQNVLASVLPGERVGNLFLANFTDTADAGRTNGLLVTRDRGSLPTKTAKEPRNGSAFAAIKNDGSVVTWGNAANGGNSSGVAAQLTSGVVEVVSTRSAFAALKNDGSVVTWGDSSFGGNSSSVTAQLASGVVEIFSTYSAFAALKSDGSVVVWGDATNGGSSSSVPAGKLASGVVKIFSTYYAFAALKNDGSVVTWGEGSNGGSSSAVAGLLADGVVEIFSTQGAFAALKSDGSVVTWGSASQGGNSVSVVNDLNGGVVKIFSNLFAFAALKNDGSVVVWGDATRGGEKTSVASLLSSGVVQIFSTQSAFAALKLDGSVVTWGEAATGGDSSAVAAQLSGVAEIIATTQAFAARKSDGSVVTWGVSGYGGSSSAVTSQLAGGVKSITAAEEAFAALKSDGSVVTWGGLLYGGDSSGVSGQLAGGVTEIFSTGYAFAALKSDGSLVTWGDANSGGNSSSVSGQLSSGVVTVANPLERRSLRRGNALAGVAVVGNAASSAQGNWQYSVDGFSWNPVSTDVSDSAALVLDNQARLRFAPTSGYHGVVGALTVRLLETGGTLAVVTGANRDVSVNGGGTVISAQTVDLNTTVFGLKPRLAVGSGLAGTVGTFFTYSISVTGTLPITISASDLPAGMNINSSSGSIAGTPTAAGTGTASIVASNSYGIVTNALAWTVAKGTPTITANPTASAITAGQALSASTLTGGTASVDGSFAWTDGTAVPSASGTYSVTFTPTDPGNYNTATANVTVTVTGLNSAPVATGTATLASVVEGVQGYVLPGDAVGHLFLNNFSDVADAGKTRTLFSAPNPAVMPGQTALERANIGAFAALKQDGSVVTWGSTITGGDSSAVSNSITSGVMEVYSSSGAFAALKANGSAVTWGDASRGGDSSGVAASLTTGVVEIFSTPSAFAALKTDGSVVTWGDLGGDSSAVGASLLAGVKTVFSSSGAFAALKTDGSVVVWGSGSYGGDSSGVAASLVSGVVTISATEQAFAALKSNGSVVAWGDGSYGGDNSAVAAQLNGANPVVALFAAKQAFAALRADGSVVTWGGYGGDSSAKAAQLASGVTTVVASKDAFAALKTNGAVVAWGGSGGNTTAVDSQLASGVVQVAANLESFAALKSDGTVVTWGGRGGDSSGVAEDLTGVIAIRGTSSSFAALKNDGSVVTWGFAAANSSAVAGQLAGGVKALFASHQVTMADFFEEDAAFAALKNDGSVVAWGVPSYGGDTAAVADQISSGVVTLATPLLKNRLVPGNALAGVAVVNNGTSEIQGTWEYSSNGSQWTTVPHSLTDASALVLDNHARLKFVPATGFTGEPGTLRVRLIETGGATPVVTGATRDVSVNGGTTVISALTVALTTTIRSSNTPPTIAVITDRIAGLDQAQNFGLALGDLQTSVENLTVTAASSNETLFPGGSLVASYGAVAGWTLTATPATGESGEANITVTVMDARGATGQTTFKITVYSAYETWARLTQGLTGSDAAAGADPDGDGVVNALEFNDGVDSSNPSTPNPVIGYLGLIQVYQQKDTGTPGLGSLWQTIGGSNVVAERVVFAKTATNLLAASVPVQRLPSTALVGLTNRTVVGAYHEFEEGEADLQSYVETSAAETALPSGTYLFAPQSAAGGPVGASNTVVWATGTYPAQTPKITMDAWSNNVLRITNVAAANPITWQAWAGTAKDQIRLELRKRSGTGSGGDPKFMLPASATSQTLAANSLDPNSVYEGSLVFMQLPTRGAIRGRTTQFYLSTGPDFPAPTTGTAPTFAPAVGVYGESFSLGTVAAGGTVLVTGSNLGGLTKDSFDFFDPSSGSAYFVLDPVTATASAVTIPVPATLNSGSYRLRYKGGTTPQVLGTLTVSGGASPFANNVSMTSTASVISVPMPSAAVGGMTLEFWIKPASGLNSGTYRVVSKNGSTGGPELAIDLNYTSSTVANLSATVNPSIGSPAVVSANFINPLAWTHVALVISGSTALLHLDGIPGASSVLMGTLGWGTQPMVFGNGFRGQLDDIRIYSGSRTGTQIGADKSGPAFSPYETSLVAYYKLDEGSGTSLADATGKNGAATGGNIAWGPGRSPGVWNIASGDYSLENDGTQLLMELGGTEGTTLYDQIFVRNGAATLDGIVNLMFIGAYTGPVSGSWHTFNLIWAQNGILFGDNYQLVFNQPGFSVDTSVVEKDGGQLWQATVRQAAPSVDTAGAAALSRPSLGIARSPGSAGSVELMYTYTRPTGGSSLNGQYTVGTMRYEVQVSHDLKTWSSAVAEEVAKVPSGAGHEIATVRVISGTGRGFLRLKVSD